MTLATGIPRERCERLGLGYLDPSTVDPEEWAGRESEGILLVRRAGEMLYRARDESVKTGSKFNAQSEDGLMVEKADIGLVGLAVMGQNLVLNMDDHGFKVAVFNRTLSTVDEFVEGSAKGTKVIGTHSLEELVSVARAAATSDVAGQGRDPLWMISSPRSFRFSRRATSSSMAAIRTIRTPSADSRGRGSGPALCRYRRVRR